MDPDVRRQIFDLLSERPQTNKVKEVRGSPRSNQKSPKAPSPSKEKADAAKAVTPGAYESTPWYQKDKIMREGVNARLSDSKASSVSEMSVSSRDRYELEGRQEEEARELFGLIDENNDDVIVKAELVRAHADSQGLFTGLDTDGTGEVNLVQWMSFLRKMGLSRGEKVVDFFLRYLKRNVLESREEGKTTRLRGATPSTGVMKDGYMGSSQRKKSAAKKTGMDLASTSRGRRRMKGMSDDAVLSVLREYHQYLMKVFEKYMKAELMVDLKQHKKHGNARDLNASDLTISEAEFTRFCKDFGLVPLMALKVAKDIYSDVCQDEEFPSDELKAYCIESSKTPEDVGLDFDLFKKALVTVSIEIFLDRDGFKSYQLKLETALKTMALSKGHKSLHTDMNGNQKPMPDFEARLFRTRKEEDEKKAEEEEDGKAMVAVRGESSSDDDDNDDDDDVTPYGMIGFEIMNLSQVFSYYASVDPMGMHSTTLGMNQWRNFVRDSKMLNQEFNMSEAEILYHSQALRAGPPGFTWTPASEKKEELDSHGHELHTVQFMHLLAVMAERRGMDMSQFVQEYISPLMKKIRVSDIEENVVEARVWDKEKDFLKPIYEHYSMIDDRSDTRMSGFEHSRGQRIKMNQRNAKKKRRVIEITRLAKFASDFNLCSRAVANEFFRQVMTNVVYGDIVDTGAMSLGLDWRGFVLCLGLLAEHKNDKAHQSGSADASDDDTTKALYLLEAMAVAKGVSIVEKARMKSLQKEVKKVLRDTTKHRQDRAEKALQSFDEQESTDRARKRLVEYKREHARRSMSDAGVYKSITADSDTVGLTESGVAEAMEGHPELFNLTISELNHRQREAAFHGHLKAASDLSIAMDILKDDVAEARRGRVKREHEEAVEALSKGLEDQLEDLNQNWRLRDESMEADFKMQIAGLEERQLMQRMAHDDEVALLQENVPKAKPPGMSESIWAQVTDTRKLKPSTALLDIDARYQRAMNSKRFDLAQEMKDRYEALAVQEWEEHELKEQEEMQMRSAQLEKTHRQEMRAMSQRHQQASNEAGKAKEEDYASLNAFYRKRLEELRKISKRCTVVHGGGAQPADGVRSLLASKSPTRSPIRYI